jgi:fermentation-respiration switch protein FrsA (DUF1100 family)
MMSILGLVLIPLLACVLLAWLFQRQMIYYPFTAEVRPVSTLLPGATDVSFETEDGLRLGGWFVPSATNESSAAVLVFNGNAGSREYRLPLATAFSARGMSVLLFDYRGFGGNPGRPSETGLIRDARAARAYLASRPDVRPERIVYFGESLGAAVAVALAAEQPPAALVLRSPFTSLVAVGQRHYPFLPVGVLLRDRYSSVDRIATLSSPLLVIAGQQDRIVPHSQSRQLFDAAPQPAKRFVSVAGAGHNDERLTAGDELVDTVVGFLLEQLAPEPEVS